MSHYNPSDELVKEKISHWRFLIYPTTFRVIRERLADVFNI
ncbi:hypothetical protein CWATWH8502_2918 [Crocosphaera watsonii WH 8502]|uniref:Uncharacterized protein n=1 Tax=Crocosphaera watsonii WH 8502 TaxID=423474 RepID=T2IAE6_CROWT|nr:hypothetical protein CWATWH8502_2918 [Crocosphaera watsonii WH 8502]